MRFLTAGESHGPQLTVIIEGLPSHLIFSKEKLDMELQRRMKGYGRGRRMQIESDQVEILSGVRFGETTGAPVTLVIQNRDFTHWQKVMGAEATPESADKRKISRPRPGHADLTGALKYDHRDMRDVLERSSARETAARVAVGAVAQMLLSELGIELLAHVRQIGEVKADEMRMEGSMFKLREQIEASHVRCLDPIASEQMMKRIDLAKEDGDSLGGIVEVIAIGVPVGLGSHVHWDRKLDGRIAQAVMSIQAFKGVEFGIGFEAAGRPGSQVMDEIIWSKESGFSRRTNRLGGFEGGMTTGEPIVVRGVMKPIPTLYRPLQSVDIETKEAFAASIERSDRCAVPSASVVAQNVVATTIAQAVLEKFPADTLDELKQSLATYQQRVKGF
ncbi:chorismate synthase [Risungbinella massiliensis]|uniref:chorismate synthase n=1 Tax=Risungbinella massiliensis TaxID=1329796 RepID=UPI0005CBD78F|nr:chorismate synthase [Risungbinella massiliensis]